MVWNKQEKRHKYWATRSSIPSFARTAHSFACSGLLASLAPSAALTRSFPRSWESEFLMSPTDLVLSHSGSDHGWFLSLLSSLFLWLLLSFSLFGGFCRNGYSQNSRKPKKAFLMESSRRRLLLGPLHTRSGQVRSEYVHFLAHLYSLHWHSGSDQLTNGRESRNTESTKSFHPTPDNPQKKNQKPNLGTPKYIK